MDWESHQFVAEIFQDGADGVEGVALKAVVDEHEAGAGAALVGGFLALADEDGGGAAGFVVDVLSGVVGGRRCRRPAGRRGLGGAGSGRW